jgi:hypothetical protein
MHIHIFSTTKNTFDIVNFLKLSLQCSAWQKKAKLRRTNSRTNCQQNKKTVCRSGEMKVHRGKVHKYLGMSLDFTNKGQCIVTMNDYLAEIVQAYDLAIAKHDDRFLPITKQCYETPAPENLFMFTVNEYCEKLPKEMAADFHTVVAKMLYVTKRARPDTCLSVAFLTTRVRATDRDDWEKLRHLIEYLRKDNIRPLVLGANNDGLLMWYVDASFAVHPNICEGILVGV